MVNWKKTEPLTIVEWVQRLIWVYIMEKMTAGLQLKIEKKVNMCEFVYE